MGLRNDIENAKQSAEGIALVARKLGYTEAWEQLQFRNGASATNLIEFLDDNPGACEAILQWILDEGCTRDGEKIEDEDDDGYTLNMEEETCESCHCIINDADTLEYREKSGDEGIPAVCTSCAEDESCP